MIRHAVLTEDQRYRYLLTRNWSDESRVTNGSSVTFVMLNPSTADHRIDDRTIVRCIDFAKSTGCTELRVVNLFALRATKPAELIRAGRVDSVGPLNDNYLQAEAQRIVHGGGLAIAGWGAHDLAWDRAEKVFELFGRDMWCYGWTKDGGPRHPLYLPKLSSLQRWKP